MNDSYTKCHVEQEVFSACVSMLTFCCAYLVSKGTLLLTVNLLIAGTSSLGLPFFHLICKAFYALIMCSNSSSQFLTEKGSSKANQELYSHSGAEIH